MGFVGKTGPSRMQWQFLFYFCFFKTGGAGQNVLIEVKVCLIYGIVQGSLVVGPNPHPSCKANPIMSRRLDF